MGESVHLPAGHRRLDYEAGIGRRCGIVANSVRTLAGFILGPRLSGTSHPSSTSKIDGDHDQVAAMSGWLAVRGPSVGSYLAVAPTRRLIKIRASQISGCAYPVGPHTPLRRVSTVRPIAPGHGCGLARSGMFLDGQTRGARLV